MYSGPIFIYHFNGYKYFSVIMCRLECLYVCLCLFFNPLFSDNSLLGFVIKFVLLPSPLLWKFN